VSVELEAFAAHLADVRERAQSEDWARRSLGALAAGLQPLLEAPVDVPRRQGGWWHQYVCPAHDTELLFDASSPFEHRCPHGDVYTGEPYDAAWLVYRHNQWGRVAWEAGLAFALTGDRRYGGLAWSVLSQYAAAYDGFLRDGPGGSEWMLKGHAFRQALSEAIWSTHLVRGYACLLACGGLAPSEQAMLEERLLRPMARTMERAHEEQVIRRGNPESNYTAWLNASLHLLGFVLDDIDLVARALTGPGGFYDHVGKAILPDGVEYELSIYYHLFVLRAYAIQADVARFGGQDLWAVPGNCGGPALKAMADALVALAEPDGALPALNEGPYRRPAYDREVCEAFLAASGAYGQAGYGRLLERACRDLGRRPGAEALWYRSDDSVFPAMRHADPTIPWNRTPCTLLPHAGYLVLRRGFLTAWLKFGHHGGSHGHLDKLSLQQAIGDRLIAPDPGSPPYGSRLRHAWYSATVSHNTVMVDGENQREAAGRLVAADLMAEAPWATVETTEAYPGVTLRRTITLHDGYLEDVFECDSAEPHTYTWLWHGDLVTPMGEPGEVEVCEGPGLAHDPARLQPYHKESKTGTHVRFHHMIGHYA